MDKYIKLNHIDTKRAAKNFAKNFEENRTYFLNGAWGSGKTEFLKESEEYSNKKYVFLDFWEIKDERDAITIAFSKLHPVWYWGIKAISVIAVVVSILMTNVVNIGLAKFFSEWLQIASLVITLVIAVYQFFKIKSNLFYSKFIVKRIKNKLLIIDDFDRIPHDKQEEIYKLFNILNGKLPIVFVGAYEKIAKNESNYLQKIIDRRIELPFDLHPENIWNTYFDVLAEKLNCEIKKDLRLTVIKEQRNLREREHFNDYVNQEFFNRGKLNHVQAYEQLLVICIYVFYPLDYKRLVSSNLFGNSQDEKSEIRPVDSLINVLKGKTDESLEPYSNTQMKPKKENYPYPFKPKKEGYLLYEEATNLTEKELEQIIENDDELKDKLLSGYNTDFYQYLTTKYHDFSLKRRDRLVNFALDLVRQYKSSAIISYIIFEKQNEIMLPKEHVSKNMLSISEERYGKTKEQMNDEIYKSWHKILESREFDFSQELYLLIKYRICSIADLAKKFPDIDITSDEYRQNKRKDSILLVYFWSQEL